MKKVDHPNLASVHEVIDVTSDDALLSKFSVLREPSLSRTFMLTLVPDQQSVRPLKAWESNHDDKADAFMARTVMELCHGGPILKIKDGEDATPYSEEEARQIFRQLVLGKRGLTSHNK